MSYVQVTNDSFNSSFSDSNISLTTEEKYYIITAKDNYAFNKLGLQISNPEIRFSDIKNRQNINKENEFFIVLDNRQIKIGKTGTFEFEPIEVGDNVWATYYKTIKIPLSVDFVLDLNYVINPILS